MLTWIIQKIFILKWKVRKLLIIYYIIGNIHVLNKKSLFIPMILKYEKGGD